MRILRGLVMLALLLAAVGWLVLRLPAFGAMPEGERLQKMQQLPQFVGGRFENSPAYQSDLALVSNVPTTNATFRVRLSFRGAGQEIGRAHV